MANISFQSGNLLVTCPADCGNAPRKSLLLDFQTNLAKGNFEPFLDLVSDSIVWERVGAETIQGKARLGEKLALMRTRQASELHVNTIITHGYTASMDGKITFHDRQLAFCHVFVFAGATKNAKISRITTYEIDLG